jgi:hypothetical protein
MIQDILNDINKHIHGIGVVPAVRVIQTKGAGIKLQASSVDKTVVINANSKLQFSDDDAVFGLGQLGQLENILGCSEYEKDPQITITKNGEALTNIEFANAAGDFTNSYRLMTKTLLDTLMPEKTFLGSKWSVELTPSLASIKRFALQAASNSDQTSFIIKTVNGKLEIHFGTPATHSGKFVFADNIQGKTKGDCIFPVTVFQKVLNLTAGAQQSTVKITEQGLICIEIDSGLVQYQYYILGLTK